MRALLFLALAGTVPAQRFDLLRHRLLPEGRQQAVVRAVSGDFDGDGRLDLATIDGATLDLAWSDGSGRLVRRGPPLPLQGAACLAAGDVDGDGDLDLLVTRGGGFAGIQPALMRNDGGGRFTDVGPQQWPTPGDSTVEIAVFDWDGDGDLDIVTCNTGVTADCNSQRYCPQRNRLFLNNGQGFFTDVTSQRLPHQPGAHTGVAVGDLDGNGVRDLAFSVRTAGALPPVPGGIRLFLVGQNRVAVETPGRIPLTPGNYQCIVSCDVDGDGDLDLIAGSEFGVLVFSNGGNAQFTLAATLPETGAYTLTATDVDRDGRPDLLATTTDVMGKPGPLRCWRNTPGGFVTAPALIEAAEASPLVAVAFDCDGDLDLDLWGAAASQQYLWHNDGAGRLLQLCDLEYGANTGITSVFADVDRDGLPDLATILANDLGNEVAIVHNDAGILSLRRSVLLPPRPSELATTLVFVDFDRDGDLDLHVGIRPRSGPGQDLMFRNDSGAFTDVTAQSLPPDNGANTVVTAGDLDGSGNTDLVLGHDFGGLRLLIGTGTGSFVDASSRLPASQDSVKGLVLLDYDGDGDLDVAWSSTGQPLRLLRNDWPAFTDVGPVVLPALPPVTGLATCDFDRDGRPDLVAGTDQLLGLRLLRNAGGTFVDETATRLPGGGVPANDITVVDLDDDGWPDLMLVWSSYRWPQQFHNAGGTFLPLAAGVLPYGYEALRGLGSADIDGDGDSDLVLRLGVLHNLARQLQETVPPRLGQGGELLLQAFASDGVNAPMCGLLLAPSLANPPVPFPLLGLLRLDPATTWLHGIHVLPPAGGEATVSYSVPASASLLGAQLSAQGLFLHTPAPASWRLGNAITLRVRL